MVVLYKYRRLFLHITLLWLQLESLCSFVRCEYPGHWMNSGSPNRRFPTYIVIISSIGHGLDNPGENRFSIQPFLDSFILSRAARRIRLASVPSRDLLFQCRVVITNSLTQ
jgi:hypothetical protein